MKHTISVIIWNLIVLCAHSSWAQKMEPAQLLAELREASKTEGIQVGIIIDDHSRPSMAQLITLSKSKMNVFQVLRDYSVEDRAFDGQYSECPRVLVQSLAGVSSRKEGNEFISWAFVMGTPDYRNWYVPTQPNDDKERLDICDVYISDGSLIGFTFTRWKKTDRKDNDGFWIFNPIQMPRLPKAS